MHISSSLIIHSPTRIFGCCLLPYFNARIISFVSLSEVNNWRILLLLRTVVIDKIGWD